MLDSFEGEALEFFGCLFQNVDLTRAEPVAGGFVPVYLAVDGVVGHPLGLDLFPPVVAGLWLDPLHLSPEGPMERAEPAEAAAGYGDRAYGTGPPTCVGVS